MLEAHSKMSLHMAVPLFRPANPAGVGQGGFHSRMWCAGRTAVPTAFTRAQSHSTHEFLSPDYNQFMWILFISCTREAAVLNARQCVQLSAHTDHLIGLSVLTVLPPRNWFLRLVSICMVHSPWQMHHCRGRIMGLIPYLARLPSV
jgi:hypothetical protein